MDAKKLKLLKFSAIMILIFLAGMLVVTYLRMADVEEELKLGKIRNNETTLVAYGDEKFFFTSEIIDDKPVFKFVNRNEKENTTKVIENYSNTYVDSEILAKDNMLFYYTGVNTCLYDIASEKSWLFAQGKMQHLTDEWYVTLLDGVLYKGIYYHSTMSTRNTVPLISDGKVQYACEDDTHLYYIAKTSKNYYALMGLNKTDLTITVYDTIAGSEESIIDVGSNKNYIFELVQYVEDELIYALRIIPKNDKSNKWDVKLTRKENADTKEFYSYVLLENEYVNEPKTFDENIYMLRFKTNESGEKLQDGYMIHNIKSDETKFEKPTLTEICLYEYSAEIKGAQLVIYKNNKEYKKVTLNGYKEGNVEIMNIYKIDDDMYYKIMLDPLKKKSTYIKVDLEGTAEIYQ